MPSGDLLQTRLDERSGARDRDPSRPLSVHEQGIETVKASGVADGALGVGDRAPDFTLPSATGERVRLSALLRDGPVVLTWYRGGWCPYCNIQLQTMQEVLPALEAAGGRLVAISPETPDNSLSTREKNELEFVVLSDRGNRVASLYGLTFALPEPVAKAYERFGFNEHNGDDSNTLPLAATYVVGRDGVISWAQVDADYRRRAEPAAIIAHLNSQGDARDRR